MSKSTLRHLKTWYTCITEGDKEAHKALLPEVAIKKEHKMSTETITRGIRYTYFGTLTGTVNDVAAAKEYLEEDDMTQYLGDVAPSVVDIRWVLKDNGHNYEVKVVSFRHLEEEENAALVEWVRGQHSDGLGEGFEQQDFAENEADEPEFDDEEDAPIYESEWEMVSFDWKTNKTKFIKDGAN